MTPIERAIVRATQSGLPLAEQPYREVAQAIGISQEQLLEHLARMLEDGRIRRVGAVPNHYALGYTANAMSVWDVADGDVAALGRAVGALPFVTHCYRRPRRLPDWPYNLFAMVHGRSRAETERPIAEIRRLLGSACRSSDVLYSVRILKKTGLRLA
jgi:DNA-binding Lrp family transcriptional regulator